MDRQFGDFDYEVTNDLGKIRDTIEDVESHVDSLHANLRGIADRLDAIHDTIKSRVDSIGWIIFWVFLMYLGSGWSGSGLDRWTDKAWYSLKHDVLFKSIAFEKRPA